LSDGSVALPAIDREVTDPTVEFRALFEGEFDYVWSVLRRLGAREADLEDLAHEVFVQVHRRRADFDRSRPVRPWLFGFAYRVAAAHRRSARARYEVLGEESQETDPAPPADEQLAGHEARMLLLRALDDVPLDRRAVLVMHEWDGEPIPEVARALGIPLNTAYSRLRLARGDLAAAVRRRARKEEVAP